MAKNTTLPTALAPGNTNHISNHQVIHETVNDLSRDTGLRDASALLSDGWALEPGGQSYVHIRRVRDRVYLHVRGLDGTNATAAFFLRLGGDAATQVSGGFGFTNGGAASMRSGVQATTTGVLYTVQPERTAVSVQMLPDQGDYKRPFGGHEREISWPTTQQWPSFLPPAVT